MSEERILVGRLWWVNLPSTGITWDHAMDLVYAYLEPDAFLTLQAFRNI